MFDDANLATTQHAKPALRGVTLTDLAPDAIGAPSVETLKAITDAFNRHDLDAIMAFFTDDAVFESPRGPDPFGRRFEGKPAVREGLAARFTGIPDVHYGDDDHFVAGDRAASEWTLTGTTTDGARLKVRGCDLWTFRDGLVAKKDSFWKIVEPS